MALAATIPRQWTALLTSWVGALIAFLSNRFPRLSATGCALYGASLFFVCAKKSKQKKAPPGIRVSLRSTPLPPVPLRGPAYKGHPWPFKPFAASMRLTPLRNTYARPADGESARMPVSRFRPIGVAGLPNRTLIVPTLCVDMQPQTLRVCGTQSVPEGFPRGAWEPSTNSEATAALPTLHHRVGPGPGPVRRLSGIVA
jgi:hypothetical protein